MSMSTMFMSSSGSFTWRSAWRTVSALSTAVVTMIVLLPANLATWNTPHQTVSPDRDPRIDPAGEWQHAGNPEERREPALPGQESQELGNGICSRVHTTARDNQMHRGCERRERDAEPRHGNLVLERYEPQHVFPVPAAEQLDRLPTNTALAVVDQRRTSGINGHDCRRAGRQRRPRARALLSAW